MFDCGVCGKFSKPGEKAERRVVETRKIVYPFRAAVHPIKRQKPKDDPGGTGTAIVKEVLVCPACTTV